MNEFTKGRFSEVIDDPTSPKAAKKLILCSGKIYYDLSEARVKAKVKDVAIVRIEQLYPFPEKQINAILKKYKGSTLAWVQEEPSNMGCLSFIQRMMPDQKFEIISRKASASPATGYAKTHKVEQEKILKLALEVKS